MRDESTKEKRIAELRNELGARLIELQNLVGPERRHLLNSAAHDIARECSRAYNEASKADK